MLRNFEFVWVSPLINVIENLDIGTRTDDELHELWQPGKVSLNFFAPGTGLIYGNVSRMFKTGQLAVEKAPFCLNAVLCCAC